ncbi:putative palmitoyltransferase ZDHHC24 [Ciona intestinalis]
MTQPSFLNGKKVAFIHIVGVAYFFLATFGVVYSCIFIAYPVLYIEPKDIQWRSICLIYVFINIIGNYFLGILNKSNYAPGIQVTDPPKSWKFCSVCDRYCPPRTHHCEICKACILKRDHHCFFFCQCVGLRNQRYFIPYTLYVALGSLHAMYILTAYLNMKYVTFKFSIYAILSYTLPGIVYNWVYTYGNITLTTASCILLLYLLFSAGFGSLFLFLAQCFLLVRGQTPYEYHKNIHIFNHGVVTNLTQVFGRFWFLHFLIPFPPNILSKQSILPCGTSNYKDV